MTAKKFKQDTIETGQIWRQKGSVLSWRVISMSEHGNVRLVSIGATQTFRTLLDEALLSGWELLSQ